MHLAAGGGDIELLQLLIGNNATVDVQDTNDETPLHLAARNGQVDAVELLLKHQPPVHVNKKPLWYQPDSHRTCLDVAIEAGQR